MPSVVEYGYLSLAYLSGSYLAQGVTHAVQSQVTLVIAAQHTVNSQVDRELAGSHTVNSQVNQVITASHAVNSQATLTLTDSHTVNSQIDRSVMASHTVNSQVNRQITGALHPVRSEVGRGNVVHEHCEDGAYLALPYLSGPYLADIICARMRSQVNRVVMETHEVRSQVDRKIPTDHTVRSQVNRKINAAHAVNSQVRRLNANVVHSQITQVLYNTTNLRILMDFPSRGTSGTNWTASSTMAGDFSINNVNSDIVEQVWRSNSVLSGITLTSDSGVPQGIFVDTMAFLNHNLTTSASVVWQASNDAGFGTIPFTETLAMTRTNFYWIAPTLPLAGYRYRRFLISDPTNSATYLQIGTIVFGSSIIFQGECFVDRVVRSTRHFADKVQTEGFTNVSNDRAIKFATGLEFRNLKYNRGNYNAIRNVFDTARTSLKCLWIPTPQFPSRFAVFGKLQAIPDEQHNVKGEDLDFVDFSLVVDESL